MNKAEALLNDIMVPQSVAFSADPSKEPHITIGKDRKITMPTELRILGVQYDHNVETVTFDCPRYWDEHDMSEMSIYINYRRADNHTGSCLATNIVIDEVDTKIMHFDWCISGNVTAISGNIIFSVCVKKTDSDGKLSNHWNSEICKEAYISEGLDSKEDFLARDPDLVTQLIQLINKYKGLATISSDIKTLREEVTAIKQKLNNSVATNDEAKKYLGVE